MSFVARISAGLKACPLCLGVLGQGLNIGEAKVCCLIGGTTDSIQLQQINELNNELEKIIVGCLRKLFT